VKFRPLPGLLVEDMETLVPFSDNVILSVDEKFLDVLGFADLLVSFSSTTIEEALQNNVPVMLYGGGGRYQHVSAVEVSPDGDCPTSAVYSVRRPEHLATAIKNILDAHSMGSDKDSLFTPYCFGADDRVGLADWLRPRGSLDSADTVTVWQK
jgi:hypothetical protein